MPSTLLIVTNSMDGSADVLVRLAAVRGLPVFRLNTDLLAGYRIHVDDGGFSLTDQTGRTVASNDLCACYYRKPWNNGTEPWVKFPAHEQQWVRGQLLRLIREIVNLCRINGVLRLVEPEADRRLDKLTQMRIAKRHFVVPSWEYVWRVAPTAGRRVTKPLDPEQVQTELARFVYTEIVQAERLAVGYPWLVQDLAQGDRDSTIVYIAGQCFGFRIKRNRTSGPTDWRERINTPEVDLWERCPVASDLTHKCQQFMAEVGLHYGRFDFIVDENGHHEFLEVNSNGQYGWLDDPDELWLHRAVLDALLSPQTTIRAPTLIGEAAG